MRISSSPSESSEPSGLEWIVLLSKTSTREKHLSNNLDVDAVVLLPQTRNGFNGLSYLS